VYHSAYANVAEYLDDDHEGPIPTLYILMRPLNKFVSAQDGVLSFTGTNFNGDNIILSGKVLYLHDIRRFVETLIQEIKNHIQHELLFGLDIVNVNWSPGVVHEEPRNTHVSYSAFDDPHNEFHMHKDAVLRTILTHPNLRGRFHFLDNQNHIVWKAGPCFAYMEVAHEVEMKLFCGTQTTVGEPGRGSELASHLIRNVSGGSLRNVLVMFQFLVMMGTYNKTSHITERDATMIRVPHPEIGRLWMLYLTFIKPLLVVWQLYFNGPSAATRTKHYLFSGPYRPVTSSELSQYLSLHSGRLLGVKISISLWRHVATWFMNHNCARFEEFLTLNAHSVLAYQSGHSKEAHGLYAGDARIPNGIDFHRFLQTMLASGGWQDLVGFPPILLNSMTQRYKQLKGKSRDDAAPPATKTSILESPKDVAAELARTIIPEFYRMQTQTRANDLASFLDAIGLDLQTPPSPLSSTASHQSSILVAHPSRIIALRRFLRDDKASFKDPQQALAVEFMAQGNSSILLIAPTGMPYLS
jgi:hypothetical protein